MKVSEVIFLIDFMTYIKIMVIYFDVKSLFVIKRSSGLRFVNVQIKGISAAAVFSEFNSMSE